MLHYGICEYIIILMILLLLFSKKEYSQFLSKQLALPIPATIMAVQQHLHVSRIYIIMLIKISDPFLDNINQGLY